MAQKAVDALSFPPSTGNAPATSGNVR